MPAKTVDTLTDEDVRRFVDACGDPTNTAAQEAMLVAGASSATGVLARVILSTGDERGRLLDLIRRAIQRG